MINFKFKFQFQTIQISPASVTNFYSFERDWVRLGIDNGGKVSYLEQLGLEKLPKIFRESNNFLFEIFKLFILN